MINELLKAFLLIFIAEMGDKTQILAMAFATKFPAKKVLAGIFAGCLINHGLAVLLGTSISRFVPMNTVQIFAGFAFVAFAIWTLRSEDDDEEEDQNKSKFGPVITVAIAFFIGELGDKTQLTAITLAADAVFPLVILAGTVSGMVVTGGLGIIVGKKLGDKMPEFAIKIVAAAVFMLFGVMKLYNTLPKSFLDIKYIIAFTIVIGSIVFILLRSAVIKRKQGKESLLVKKSRELHDYYNQAQKNIESLCLGEKNCGKCEGKKCLVGYTKLLIKNGMEGIDLKDLNSAPSIKDYDKEKVIETLRITLSLLRDDPSYESFENIHRIRRNLEIILFGNSIEKMNDWNEYISKLKMLNKDIVEKILIGV